MPIKTAIFPVGGLGTRFLPATKAMPKEMLPVASKPLIQYAFEEAVNAGIEQCIFVTGRNKNAISNHFDHSFELERTLSDEDKQEALKQTTEWIPEAGQIAFVRQQKPKGLGHAVWCARNFINHEPFAVLLADELYLSKRGLLAEMVEAYDKTGGNVIALCDVPKEQVNRYGIVDSETRDGRITIHGMVEKPAVGEAPSSLAITGRYILQPEIMDILATQEAGRGGEIQLTDAMATLLTDSPFYGHLYEGGRYDCGNQLGFLEANIAFALAESNDPAAIKTLLQQYSS